MTAIRYTLLPLCFAPALMPCFGQTTGKPVLTPAEPPPAAVAAQPEMQQGGPADSSTYVIGPQDQIKIVVWKEQQLSDAVTVRPDGMISLPLIHDIQAAGFTPTQLSKNITEKLQKFVTDPVVDVTVVSVNSKRIYMVGEVGHVGPIPMMPGMTILQAIASAGGLTPYANAKKIYILRGAAASQKQIPFNYNKAKKGDMQGIVLEPGDTIVVP